MKKKAVDLYGIHVVETILQQCPENVLQIMVSKQSDQHLQDITKLAKQFKIATEMWDRKKLTEHLGTDAHQGIAIRVKQDLAQDFGQFKEFLRNFSEPSGLVLLLDQVQDPHNLGACIRSAAGCGAACVVVAKQHSSEITASVCKASSGAAVFVPVFYVSNIINALDELKKHRFWVYGASVAADKSLPAVDFAGRSALIMGREDRAIRSLVAQSCDELFKIPIYNNKLESFNLSVATGITLYTAAQQVLA